MRTDSSPVRTIALLAVALAGLSLSGTSAVAKGPMDKITVTGGELARSIEITQGDALGEFNPWAGRFLGERVDRAPDVGNAATVTLYLKDEAGNYEPLYSFEYYREASGGYIYVPGPGDAAYELNRTTIITQGDGKWFKASAGWDALVAAEEQIRPPATGDGGLR